MCYNKTQSSNITTRHIYRHNCYIESNYNIKPLGREGYLLNIKTYIKSKGPFKGALRPNI